MNNDLNNSESREKLHAYLIERAAKSRKHARKNDYISTLCYLAAIVASFAATLCAAFGDLPKAAIAAITAIPGTALLLNSVFCFDKKCQWHRRRKLKYDTFSMRMSYEGADAASISRELREFEEKADADYPRFGASGTLKKEAL
ncbi:MAG: hypothetical protein AYP45_08995 [Candidatus Brocadia carolinensis]|uniref:SMODS and SLOG-associating 2TM effector domain-containing protein n=1 Tax=Candidatus Brocadia carolinensis TaxID=1004156 RepID=A0A1V4ATJ9_9BACT|nr:MAG: hypothetical protein AYP45_08995 [Candidatus Brocadia caroliniensis]